MNYICKKIEILYYLICFINYYLPLYSTQYVTLTPPAGKPISWLPTHPTLPRNRENRCSIATLRQLHVNCFQMHQMHRGSQSVVKRNQLKALRQLRVNCFLLYRVHRENHLRNGFNTM